MDHSPDLLPTRHSLIERARATHDGQVWEDLVGYYRPFIDKILLHMGLRGADLEDVRQQILLKLWRGLADYQRSENRARFRNWLSTLIRNASIDWFRSQTRDRRHASEVAKELPEFTPEDPEIEQFIDREWQRHILGLAMRNLKQIFSGKAMTVFALSLKGDPTEAIAAKLNLTKESVYMLKMRVKSRLTQEIARLRSELEGDPP